MEMSGEAKISAVLGSDKESNIDRWLNEIDCKVDMVNNKALRVAEKFNDVLSDNIQLNGDNIQLNVDRGTSTSECQLERRLVCIFDAVVRVETNIGDIIDRCRI